MHLHLRIGWSQNLDQLVHAKKRMRIRRGASWRSTMFLKYTNCCTPVSLPRLRLGPVWSQFSVHGVLYVRIYWCIQRQVKQIMKKCARPWTSRGKDAKSRGTDIVGGGKDIKRSARDYMSCSKRFGTMTASAFSETPFDRKPPLTKKLFSE